MDLTPIQTQVPHFEHPARLRHQQDWHEQVLDLCQKRLAKVGDRVVIRMQSACQKPKRNTFMGRLLYLARREHARGISIKQQPQQYFRRKCFPAHRRIPPIDPAQIPLGYDLHHKAHQVIRPHGVSQTYCLLQRFFVIRSPKFAAHALSPSPTGC